MKPQKCDKDGEATAGEKEYQAPYRQHEEDDFQNVPQDTVMHLPVCKLVFLDKVGFG